MQLDENENQKIGLKQSLPSSSLKKDDENIFKAFVSFLEQESQAATGPHLLSLHNETESNRASSNPGDSNNFQAQRNSSTILKDILYDNQ